MIYLGGGIVMKLVVTAVTAALVTTACGAQVNGSAVPAAGTSESPAPAPFRGPSWTEYLDTQSGRTCTLKNPSPATAGNVDARLTQTVVSTATRPSGEVVNYRIATSATVLGGGVPPIRSALKVPYEVLRTGQLGVTPDAYALGGGLALTFQGFEIYPTVRELQAGRSQRSALTGLLRGATATTRHQVEQLTTSGDVLKFRMSFIISAAPPRASIVTPSGTYRNLVGVKVAFSKMTLVNGSQQAKQAFSATSGLGKAFGNSLLYFSRGTGLVQGTSAGTEEQLTGCRG